jgi:hypothetical protein
MPPKLCMSDMAGHCQGRLLSAVCKLYKGLVQGQAYLKMSALDEMSVREYSNKMARREGSRHCYAIKWLIVLPVISMQKLLQFLRKIWERTF